MSQDLNEDELNELADLLLLSQKSKAREALCIKIGISYYKELGFIYESSDSSFAINLINHLNDVGNTKAICQLCCKELSPIFKGGKHESLLKEIAVKLNCNHELRHNYPNPSIVEKPTSSTSSPVPEFGINPPLQPDTSKPQSWLKLFSSVKYKLFAGAVVLLTGFTGFYLYEQNMSYSREYDQLQSLLKDKDWKKADEETINKMREVSGKKEGGLTLDDLNNYSCKDLRTIDKLWTKYSEGKFGFSVQKRIWDEAAGGVQTKLENNQVLLNDFAQRVGWRDSVTSLDNKVEYKQISQDKIRYDITAPNGHLPTLYGIGVWWYGVAPGGGYGGSAFSLRLEQCNIR